MLISAPAVLNRARTVLRVAKRLRASLDAHTCLTRLGEAGTDAFTIMKLAGHSRVTVSQRFVHPTPEAVERTLTVWRFSTG